MFLYHYWWTMLHLNIKECFQHFQFSDLVMKVNTARTESKKGILIPCPANSWHIGKLGPSGDLNTNLMDTQLANFSIKSAWRSWCKDVAIKISWTLNLSRIWVAGSQRSYTVARDWRGKVRCLARKAIKMISNSKCCN